MRAKLIFAVNLVFGVGLFAYFLQRFGAPALDILRAGASVGLLLLFLAAAASTVLCLSWRWRYILAGLCEPPRLPRLAFYRSAAHSLAVLLPSGKAAGDPLRAWLAARDRVGGGRAIASVAMDRTQELASTAPFSLLFVTLLLREHIPELEQILVTLAVATLGLLLGVGVAAQRLRSGKGLVAPLVKSIRLDRLRFVEQHQSLFEDADAAGARLVAQPKRIRIAFAAGLLANLLVIGEFAILLAAFGLPTTPTTVVAAIVATGAAHTLPIPGGVGVLEGANLWLFALLGYPSDVGLAVGLAARVRELLWMLPGLTYLLLRSLRASRSKLRAAR